MRTEKTEILIVGAAASSTVAAGLMRRQGRRVPIIEREAFRRCYICVPERLCAI